MLSVNKEPASVAVGGPGWRDVLNSVSEMNLWGVTRREDRHEWRKYKEQAEALLNTPRKPLPKVPNLLNIKETWK